MSPADVANAATFTVNVPAGNEVVVRVNQTIVVFDPASGLTLKGLVIQPGVPNPGNPAQVTFEAACYTAPNFAALNSVNLKMFIYGSDFAKGTV